MRRYRAVHLNGCAVPGGAQQPMEGHAAADARGDDDPVLGQGRELAAVVEVVERLAPNLAGDAVAVHTRGEFP